MNRSNRRTSADYPQEFLWGVAAASYQVEGAVTTDGRGPSIWDTFSHTPGKVHLGHTGDRAVDQYNRYSEDIRHMRNLGVGAYRFSIAWPRIQPDGSGGFTEKGFDYYKRLADELHAADIRTAATLYHWDLPQSLEDRGGWPARDTASRFGDYSREVFRRLGDRIDLWITLNEPWCSSILGYLTGVHAPGRRNRSSAWAAGHHLLLGHGLAVQAYRAERGYGKETAPIGITHNLESPRPATLRPEDRDAADRWLDMRSRFFLDPLIGRGYPQRHFSAYPEKTPPPVENGDMEIIGAPIDFLGLNYYFEPAIADAPVGEEGSYRDGLPSHPEGFREVPFYHERTDMEWPITPRGLYRHLKWVWEYTEGRYPLYITENGCAMPDRLSADGQGCHDPRRIAYLREHFSAALDAIEEGVDLRGYFVWSLIDNFEWSYGYAKRFGLVYVDYTDLRRIPKSSYYYFREVISGAEAL